MVKKFMHLHSPCEHGRHAVSSTEVDETVVAQPRATPTHQPKSFGQMNWEKIVKVVRQERNKYSHRKMFKSKTVSHQEAPQPHKKGASFPFTKHHFNSSGITRSGSLSFFSDSFLQEIKTH